MLSVMFYKMGAYLAARLPEWTSESITEALVKLQYAFRIRARRYLEGQLRMALGKDIGTEELRRITRRNFSNFGKSIYYFLRLPAMTREELAARCDANGMEKLVAKLPGGVVLVGPHLGPWEVGGACIAGLGLRIRTVALPHPSGEVTRFFDRHRRRAGVESEPLNGSVESLRSALNDGRAVALLIDRPYYNRSDIVTWFGRDTSMPVGHAALAVRCGAPVVTCVCVFREDGGFKLDWRGPYYPNPALGSAEAMEELRDRCLRDMEEFIVKYPEQWFNFQPSGDHRA